MWFQALKSDSVPENRIFPHLTEDWNWLSTPALYIYIYIYMRTVPPATSIQKVEFFLPSLLLALQVYWPESSSLAWRIVRVLLLPRFTPSLVQSILGEGKLLTEHLRWSDELYVTDWFLSSGLISGGPEYIINKQNLKKGKRMTKKNYKMRRESKGDKTKLTFTYDCNMKCWFNVPSNVLALHVYWPASPKATRLIVRMLLLPRFNPSLVQSILGEGKPLREHLNWSGELYVTDWFLSSGFT